MEAGGAEDGALLQVVLPVLLPALLAAVGGQGAAGARHHAARLQGDPAPGADLASRMIRFYITDKIQ